MKLIANLFSWAFTLAVFLIIAVPVVIISIPVGQYLWQKHLTAYHVVTHQPPAYQSR